MNIKWMFFLASAGIATGIISVFVYNETPENPPPLSVSYNPYETGVYATGIIESNQPTGSDISIYPEVSGTVMKIFIKEGQFVSKNSPLFSLDDSVQQAIVAADQAQYLLQQATVKSLSEQLDKNERAYTYNKQSISQNALDNARNAVKIAHQNAEIAYNQFLQAKTLLDKYVIVAPANGKILRVATAIGNNATPMGGYDSYTHTLLPPIQMSHESDKLTVRCFLNEILVPRLPMNTTLEATLFVRGLNNKSVPLQYTGMQPYAQPNLRLPSPISNRVDARALPILFTFTQPKDINMFPGQLVDVYIKTFS